MSDHFCHLFTQDSNLLGEAGTVSGIETGTGDKCRDSAFEQLKSALNEKGGINTIDVAFATPPKKAELKYKDFRCHDFSQFCQDGLNTIAQNIMNASSISSCFHSIPLSGFVVALSKIAGHQDREAAIALSLLVHAPKCRSENEVVRLLDLTNKSAETSLSVAKSPDCLSNARNLLLKPPLSKILMSNLSLLKSDLEDIETVFVTMSDFHIRGWSVLQSAPSMVVINISALGNTLHLEHYIPLAVLLGHEMRHVLVRKHHKNDLNFSSLTDPSLISSCLSVGNCESGLWFELTSIGQKYLFEKHPKKVHNLISEIEKGLQGLQTPALNQGQEIQRYDCGEGF
jgi:hypothetical protein